MGGIFLGLALLSVTPQGLSADPSVALPVTYSYNLDPDIARDGTRMVFIKILEGHEQLFIANLDGSGERQLTKDAVDHEDPAWSPDGTQIAYVRIENGRNTLHSISVATSADRQLMRFRLNPIHPAWMPDGVSLLFCADDDLHPPLKNEAAIYRLDVKSGRITTLISGGTNTYPVPSPDGRRIAFRKMLDLNSEVFVAAIDGSDQRNLTHHPSFEGWPAWSPDGRRIVFAANRNSSYQIFVMNADGSAVTLVANTEGRATAPKWSPDGTRIFFPNCWRTGLKSACEIMSARAP